MDQGGLGFVIKDAISTAIVRVGYIHANAGQAAAFRKCTVIDNGDAVRYRDGAGFTCWALDELGLEFVIQNSIYTAVICIGWIHANTGQTAAIRKCTVLNFGHACRNGDAGQTVATRKRRVPDVGNACRNGDAGQTAAIIKRIISNGGDGTGDGDGTGFTCRALNQDGLGFVVKDAISTAIVRVGCIH